MKYGLVPEQVEQKSLQSEEFREKCNFHRLGKVGKDAPKRLCKSSTEKQPFLIKKQLFVIRVRGKASRNTYFCWASEKEDQNIVKNRFVRQELFAVRGQFHP